MHTLTLKESRDVSGGFFIGESLIGASLVTSGFYGLVSWKTAASIGAGLGTGLAFFDSLSEPAIEYIAGALSGAAITGAFYGAGQWASKLSRPKT